MRRYASSLGGARRPRPCTSRRSTGTLTATGGGSGNPVTFTSQTTGVCTTGGTNGSTIPGVTAGTCTIAANQAGNAAYNPAPQVVLSFAAEPPAAFCPTRTSIEALGEALLDFTQPADLTDWLRQHG